MDVLEIASQLARSMYTNEFCSICGKTITVDDAKTTVFAGTGENKVSRLAHGDCSGRRLPEETWTYSAADRI